MTTENQAPEGAPMLSQQEIAGLAEDWATDVIPDVHTLVLEVERKVRAALVAQPQHSAEPLTYEQFKADYPSRGFSALDGHLIPWVLDWANRQFASRSALAAQPGAADRLHLAKLYNAGWHDHSSGADYRPGEALDEWFAAPQTQPVPVALTDEQVDKLPWGPHEGNPVTFAEGLRDFASVVIAEFCRINGIPAPQTKEQP